jgi:hypothetical protein
MSKVPKVVEFYLFYIKKMACRGVAKGEDWSKAIPLL